MEQKRVTSAPNPKIFFYDQEIDFLCNKILKLLDSKEFSSIIPDCKSLIRSLLFISNPQVACKTFAVLIGLAEIFHSKQDSINACKYLAGAEQILALVNQQDLVRDFEKIKNSVLTCAGNRETCRTGLGNLDFTVCEQKGVGVVGTDLRGKKDYFAGDFKRPATAGRKGTWSQASPNSLELRYGINSTRPNSAKRSKKNKVWQNESVDFTKFKISSFQSPMKETLLINRKRYKSEDFSQKIDMMTPPRTPESLIKISIITDSKPDSKSDSKPESIINQKQIRPKSSRQKTFNKTVNPKSAYEKLKFTQNNPKPIKVSKIIQRPEASQEKRTAIKPNQLKDLNKPNFQNLNTQIIKTQENKPKASIKSEETIKINLKIKKCKIVYKEITKSFISNLVKLQAWVRGYLAREKFELMKKSKIKNFRYFAIILKNQILHIRVYKENENIMAVGFTANDTKRVSIDCENLKKVDPSNFHLSDSGELLYSKLFNKDIYEFSLILTLQAIIQNTVTDVEYYLNKKKTLIKIKTNYLNNPYELSVQYTDKGNFEDYIKDSINNYLNINEDKLELDYNKSYSEKHLIYKVRCKQSNKILHIFIYNLITSERKEIEFCILDFSTPSKTLFFVPNEKFSSLIEDSILLNHNNFIYFLAIDHKNIGKTLERLNFRFIQSIKKQINNDDFIIRCFNHTTNKEKYLFECIHPEKTLIKSIQLSPKEIKKLFQISKDKIESSIDTILSSFCIKDLELTPIPIKKLSSKKLTNSVNFLNVLKRLQKRFRTRFIRNKKALENLDLTSIYSLSKLIQGTIYTFSIYKIEAGLIIEGCSSSQTIFKYIKNPLDYVSVMNKISDLRKLIDATTIVNNKIVITRAHINIYADDPENSFYIETPFKPDKEQELKGWPVLTLKELNGAFYILKASIDTDKSMRVKLIPLKANLSPMTRLFSSEEIVKFLGIYDPKSLIPSLRISYGAIVTTDLVRYSVPVIVDELLNVHIISKIAVRYGSSLYLICVAFSEDPGNYELSELKFFAKLNSSLESCRKTIINISQAAQMTGIDSKSVSAIAEYISKNMIIINNEEFYIDCSKPPIVLDIFIIKLQAMIRGYRVRRKYHVKILLMFKENFKIQGSSFTILIYLIFSKTFLAAVKGFEIFKNQLNDKFMDQFYRSSNRKHFVFQEVLNNLKKSDKKFTFLHNNVNNHALRRRPTIELAQASVVPNLMSYIRRSSAKGNEDYELITNFSITPNLITFNVKVYKNEVRTFFEINHEGQVLTKNIDNGIKEYEIFAKLIHVDVDRKKIVIEDKSLFNRIVFVDGKKVSVIIFKNKNGLYVDGCILDGKKPSFIYLGENAKVNSIMTKLRISAGKLVLSNY